MDADENKSPRVRTSGQSQENRKVGRYLEKKNYIKVPTLYNFLFKFTIFLIFFLQGTYLVKIFFLKVPYLAIFRALGHLNLSASKIKNKNTDMMIYYISFKRAYTFCYYLLKFKQFKNISLFRELPI